MKSPNRPASGRGFTLMELMVAMAITTIIVTVLVSITSIAVDTWNRSRAEMRAARQAKAMIDAMAADFEVLVSRRGNAFEWLSARSNPPGQSSNAAELVFFTAATDRYRGEVGNPNLDRGGDVSCVGYRLDYRDPINGGTAQNQTFVLNRHLVDPDNTFANLLGVAELDAEFATAYGRELSNVQNFVCENVYQFTVAFLVQVTDNSQNRPTEVVTKIVLGQGMGASELSLRGNGITVTPGASPEIAAGRIVGVELSLTVLSDSGVDQLRRGPGLGRDSKFLARNSYQYSRVVQLPSM